MLWPARFGEVLVMSKETFGSLQNRRFHLYGTKTIFSSTIAVNSLAFMLWLCSKQPQLPDEDGTGKCQDDGRSGTADRGRAGPGPSPASLNNKSSALFSTEFLLSHSSVQNAGYCTVSTTQLTVCASGRAWILLEAKSDCDPNLITHHLDPQCFACSVASARVPGPVLPMNGSGLVMTRVGDWY